MVARRPISLRLDDRTVAEIDRLAAAAPVGQYLDRTEWIRQAIAEKIARANDPDMIAVPHRPPVPVPPEPPTKPGHGKPDAGLFRRNVTPIPKSKH